MHVSFEILVILVIIALAFDFLNGLHDAANSIATVVATRVLQAALGGAVGGQLQLPRDLRVRAPCRRNGRQGHHRGQHHRPDRDLRGA